MEEIVIIKNFLKAIFYDSKRENFSRTALFNFIFFLSAIALIVITIVLNIKGIELQPEIYVFVGGSVFGGIMQYSYGKKLDKEKEIKLP